GVRGGADVGSVATRDGDTVSVLVWHYHDDDLAGPDARVSLDVAHLPKAFAHGARLVHYRIDRDHSNSYAAWLAMGSPIAPSDAQRKTLIEASRLTALAPEGAAVAVTRGGAQLDFTLPRQGVSLLVLTPN
ncbi:MAG: beta-xylosidase, partial [Caulobacter sp.]|nr:beta-xylosidase [Caulobacter sp.]